MTQQRPNEPPQGPGPWWAGCVTALVLILIILASWAVYQWLF